MLNSVTENVRSRLTAPERRRQLLGIGLRKLTERPLHDLPLDEIAAEAGISRGLLFHYFPNKNAYFEALINAAIRRVQRNTAPDDDAAPVEALHQLTTRLYSQIDRRRELFIALAFGSGPLAMGGNRVGTLRANLARTVHDRTGAPDSKLPVTHAWIAYTEDRALQWTAVPSSARTSSLEDEAAHCVAALTALLQLPVPGDGPRYGAINPPAPGNDGCPAFG